MFAPAPFESPASNAAAVRWVRTRDGWEKDVWARRLKVDNPGLHPAGIAAGLLLASMVALGGFRPIRAAKRTQS